MWKFLKIYEQFDFDEDDPWGEERAVIKEPKFEIGDKVKTRYEILDSSRSVYIERYEIGEVMKTEKEKNQFSYIIEFEGNRIFKVLDEHQNKFYILEKI